MADPQVKKIITTGRFMDFVTSEGWEFVQRKNLSGIVGIIAVTQDRKLVLVEQYRPPVGRRVIELPAGLVGDEPDGADESMLKAARRELLEETGYQAQLWTHLFEGAASPGITNEVMTIYRADGLEKVEAGGGVGHEAINVHEVPLDQLEAWLKQQIAQGKLIDLKVYAALGVVNRS